MESKYRNDSDGRGTYWDGTPEEKAAYDAWWAAEQIPKSISMRQCRLYLNSITLLDDVDAAIMQMPKSAQIEWEYATEVRRDNPLVPAMQQMFGWTDSQMDEMFTIAAGL